RLLQGSDDFLSWRLHGDGGFLGQSSSGRGQLVAVQLGSLEQPFGDELNSPGAIEISSHKAAAWLEIGQNRSSATDNIKIIDGQGHADFSGYGQQMQDGIGRPAGGGNTGNSIFERLAGQNFARFQAT